MVNFSSTLYRAQDLVLANEAYQVNEIERRVTVTFEKGWQRVYERDIMRAKIYA